MRTKTSVRLCKCTGHFFERANKTVLHHNSCPLRELQELYGYKIDAYMLKLK